LTQSREFCERFDNEAKAQASLAHPNIVQVTDFFEMQGQYYLVMEYIEGRSLEQMSEQSGI